MCRYYLEGMIRGFGDDKWSQVTEALYDPEGRGGGGAKSFPSPPGTDGTAEGEDERPDNAPDSAKFDRNVY